MMRALTRFFCNDVPPKTYYFSTKTPILVRLREEALGSLVRIAFLANVCIVSDQTFEAGNVKYCPQLHARSGLRFIIGLQEDA
jgi:hypothetical protein